MSWQDEEMHYDKDHGKIVETDDDQIELPTPNTRKAKIDSIRASIKKSIRGQGDLAKSYPKVNPDGSITHTNVRPTHETLSPSLKSARIKAMAIAAFSSPSAKKKANAMPAPTPTSTPVARPVPSHETQFKEPIYNGKNKNVLVTGVAGFLGSHVARYCSEMGMNVIGIDDMSGGFLSNIPPEVTFVQCDIRDPKKLQNIFAEYSFLF